MSDVAQLDEVLQPAPAHADPAAGASKSVLQAVAVGCGVTAVMVSAIFAGLAAWRWMAGGGGNMVLARVAAATPQSGGSAAGTSAAASLEPAMVEPPQSDLEKWLTAAAAAVEAKGTVLDDPTLDRFASAAQMVAAQEEIPRTQRWEFVFPEGLTEVTYHTQMDSLGIELGVVTPGRPGSKDLGEIEYLSKLAQAAPGRRRAPAKDEKRLYLTWSRGDLDLADRKLLQRLGIDDKGKLLLHFCPESLEQKLADLELVFQNRKPAQIYRTRFSVRAMASGYEPYVASQVARQ
jgi:hypothetical protein